MCIRDRVGGASWLDRIGLDYSLSLSPLRCHTSEVSEYRGLAFRTKVSVARIPVSVCVCTSRPLCKKCNADFKGGKRKFCQKCR